jgi:hypothetical protein
MNQQLTSNTFAMLLTFLSFRLKYIDGVDKKAHFLASPSTVAGWHMS